MEGAKDRWSGLVRRWRRSGQPVREFAQATGINASTLAYWAWRLKREGEGKERGRRGRRESNAEGDRGGFVSLLASCAMHRIEPWAYLRDLFCLLPRWPVSRVLELAPASWGTTTQDPQVAQQLEANIFRRATLLPAPQAATA